MARTRTLLITIGKTFRGLRAGWLMLGIALLMLAALELALRAGFAFKDSVFKPTHPETAVLARGYGGETWPVDYFRDEARMRDRWHSYVYFRHVPFRSPHINIDADGLRFTWDDAAARARIGGKERLIYVFGGSTAWGVAARDDATIPSMLARDLVGRGWNVRVKNFGEIGYVSTQEVVALLRCLQAGERPDLVVFYDGVNDVTAALQEGRAGVPENEDNRRREFNSTQNPGRLVNALGYSLIHDSALFRLAGSLQSRLRGADAGLAVKFATLDADARAKLADEVLSTYAANVRLVESLAEAYKFEAEFCWQPVVFTKPRLDPYESSEARKYAPLQPLMLDVYERLPRQTELVSNPRFHDLSRILDDSDTLDFIDFCHVTEAADARIASRIAVDLNQALKLTESHR
ncbi:MAG: hypothetical protein KGM43_11355 [Planctomycetota bacterium]|nr:hypothetical protein [Planctomycetota bacterium]